MNKKTKIEKTSPEEWLHIESLDLKGTGVARSQAGKVIFVEGALPTEVVQANVKRAKEQWEEATLRTIAKESHLRVRPRCTYYGICGGCAMQHLHVSGQVAMKQRVLEDNLWHIGKVKAEQILRPIEGPAWEYRWRARLSVRYVRKKEQVLIGFREKSSRYVADMETCEVLPKEMSNLLMPLRELIGSMDGRDHLPQIEVAIGDAVIALVLRHLEALSNPDLQRLRAFAQQHQQANPAGKKLEWWLQPKGPDTAHLLDEETPSTLAYQLPEFGITMPFKPTDFTQVNPFINQVLVERAVRLLDIQPDERVIDWFCGLGNFTLPLSTKAKEVLGIEGSETLVQRSQENAQFNQRNNVRFEARNLFEMNAQDLIHYGEADRWLVDPPRDGAMALFEALAALHQDNPSSFKRPKRIVYVSCNPATLARDADILVYQAGYRCTQAGVVNMFPHTGHVESMAVFDDELN